MIRAITNQQVGLNVITELIIGYALPGKPIAMMLFKTWGYITMSQALTFTSDFKLGHYKKIPPRTMFSSQIIATIIAGTVQLGVQAWMFSNIEDICDPGQVNGFICPNTEGVRRPHREVPAVQVPALAIQPPTKAFESSIIPDNPCYQSDLTNRNNCKPNHPPPPPPRHPDPLNIHPPT
jgi:OPT oligopeptide transporter protein